MAAALGMAAQPLAPTAHFNNSINTFFFFFIPRRQYSNDGKLKCTPGGTPSQCVHGGTSLVGSTLMQL